MIRIIVAEDHELVRQGLVSLLERQSNFEVISEAEDGAQAVEKAAKLKPNILLLDLTLPRLHGLDVLTALKEQKSTYSIILTMHSDRVSVLESFRLGAKAFVRKESPFSELVSTIHEVARGGYSISPQFEPILRENLMRTLGGKPRDVSGELTRREQIVAQEVAKGKGNSEIGKQLGISLRTVEKHRANAMRRLGVRNEAELVRFAVRHNLVKL